MTQQDPLISGLNPEQLEAVTLPDQNVLVLAGAGSGKTRVLTSRIAWLIREHRAWPSEILAVTFTNKASREMLSRIEAMMPEVPTRGMWVGTFHGLCNRMLRIHAAEAGLQPGFQIIDQADQLSVVKRVMKAAGVAKETIEPKAVQAYIGRMKEQGLRSAAVKGPDAKLPNAALALQLYKLYESLCYREGIVDFAELLLRSYELLQRNELIRRHYAERFSHILVDEFQDTNVLQYRWLKALAGYGVGPQREPGITNTIFAVGDDDQSIYAFRGANVGNMEDFRRELSVEKVIRLEQNYRSTGHILDAANALIGNNTKRLGKNLWTAAGAGEKIRVMPTASGEAEARFVAEEIESGHARGKKYSDFAILYRSNAQSRAIESVLMACGIPYRIYGGHRFFERAHVKDVLAYLRLVENPADNTAFLRAVNMPARGIGEKTLEKLAATAEAEGLSMMEAVSAMTGAAAAKLRGFAELVVAMQSEAAGKSLVDVVRLVCERSTLKAYYVALDAKEKTSKAEDLAEIVSAAAAFLKNANLDANADAMTAAGDDELSPLSTFLALATLEAGDNQAGAEQDAVQLMTVHAAKGLEFPSVFITGLEENLFPHASARRENGDAGLEEERRLMYVAITRARRELCLTFAASRFVNGTTQDQMQSSFIDEIPQEHLKWLKDASSIRRSSWDDESEGWGSGRRGRSGGWGESQYGSSYGSSYGSRSRSGGYSSSYSRGGASGSYGQGGYSRGGARTGSGVTSSARGYSFKPAGGSSSGISSTEPMLKRRTEAGWHAGQKVRNAKLGEGVVVAVAGSGEQTKIQVAFPGAGIKQFVAAKAKLEKI